MVNKAQLTIIFNKLFYGAFQNREAIGKYDAHLNDLSWSLHSHAKYRIIVQPISEKNRMLCGKPNTFSHTQFITYILPSEF